MRKLNIEIRRAAHIHVWRIHPRLTYSSRAKHRKEHCRGKQGSGLDDQAAHSWDYIPKGTQRPENAAKASAGQRVSGTASLEQNGMRERGHSSPAGYRLHTGTALQGGLVWPESRGDTGAAEQPFLVTECCSTRSPWGWKRAYPYLQRPPAAQQGGALADRNLYASKTSFVIHALQQWYLRNHCLLFHSLN